MSTICWTAEQEQAISARRRHVLVSAAAGSGKTAVLVERIVRRITMEAGDIDRLLIVTFTDAAAAQMRDRLVQRIHEGLAEAPGDAHLLRQLLLLPGASISTLHAFCLRVVRQHFYRLGLDPAFQVLDEHEARLLRLEALDAVLEGMYEDMQPGDAFARLVTAYGGSAGDESLQGFLLNMHDYSRSLPDPEHWLQSSIAPYAALEADKFATSPWAAELQQLVLVRIAQAERVLRRALAVALGPGGSPNHAVTYEQDLERMQALREAARQGWLALVDNAALCEFGRLQPARGDDSDPDVRKRGTVLREKAKQLVQEKVFDPLLSRPLPDETNTWRELAPALAALVRCVIRLDEVYSAAKNERGLIDFGDIEHLCLALLNVPDVAQEVGSRFDEVLIDECQDLNGVQDAILERIARQPADGGELFLVGDVKQSVYRFRQADPGLFLARYQNAKDEPDAPQRRIDLQANFRSRPGVLSAVNFLFRQVMTEAAGEMDYGPEAELVPGLSFGPEVPDSPVELHILERKRDLLGATDEQSEQRRAPDETGSEEGPDSAADGYSEEDDLSAFQREARYTAEHIQRLIRDERAQVWDNRLGRYRPARYGDVVILLRATKRRDYELLELLQAAGVPAYAELGTGYFAATEVDTMLALLKVLDNPRQDIPLAAVLRNILGLSAEDLARLRVHCRTGDLYDAVLAAAATAGDVNGTNGGDPATETVPLVALHDLPERLRAFRETLDAWRTLARRASLSKLVWHLLGETRYFDYVGALPGGRQRQANLRALYERAQQFNHFSRHGLSRFLRFIEKLQDADGDLGAAPALGEADDVVRIMSVHKSKGLEFPFVYVLDAGRGMKAGGNKGHRDLAFHRDLGLGAGRVDGERRLAQTSLLLEAVKWRRQREELAEEMRLLYVALTRARERLIVVGSVADIDATALDWAEAVPKGGPTLADERLLTAGSWLDWICPAVMRHADGVPLRERAEAQVGVAVQLGNLSVAGDPSSWEIHIGGRAAGGADGRTHREPPLPWADVARLGTVALEAAASREAAFAVDDSASVLRQDDGDRVIRVDDSDSVIRDLRRRIEWTYSQQNVSGRAAKQSVSELKRRWDALMTEEAAQAGPVAARRHRLDERPAFLQAAGRPLSAAEKGSTVHLVLQHVDLTAILDEAGLTDQLRSLKARQMLTPVQAASVDVERLAAFFASDLGRRLQDAPGRVQREVPFTMALPAAQAYPDLNPDEAAGEAVIVQGIIDCLLPGDDGLLLIDFKTDRVSEAGVATAAAGYKSQIGLYARAVEHMYGRPVTEMYLVFLNAGRAVRVG